MTTPDDLLREPGRDPMFGRPASTPYAGGTGSTGSPASHARREHEDESGLSAYRQAQVLGLLQEAGTIGLTWTELGDRLGWHHGQSTGALSALHKADEIAALADKRKRSTIYVLKEFVAGRPTREVGATRGNTELAIANTKLQVENDALNARIVELQGAVDERNELILGLGETEARLRRNLTEVSSSRARAEQQVALATEQMARLDDERARAVSDATVARHDLAEARAAQEYLVHENQALRIARALTQLEDAELEVWTLIGERLQEYLTHPEEETIRIRLRTVRTMWDAMARQVAATWPPPERATPPEAPAPGN